jgi:hypothetical protein
MDGDSLRGFIDAWRPHLTTVAAEAATSAANRVTQPANVARDQSIVGAHATGSVGEAQGITSPPTVAAAADGVLPMVVSVVLRVRGGRASAAALKTLNLSYDAGDGLFATLTHRSRRTRPPARGCGAETVAAAAAAAALTRTKFCFKLHRTTIETSKTTTASAYAGAGGHARTSSASPNAATFTVPAVRAAGTMRRRPEKSSPLPPPPPPPPPINPSNARSFSPGRRFSDISSADGRVFESSQHSRQPNAPVDRAFDENFPWKQPTQVAMTSEVEAVVEVCFLRFQGAIEPYVCYRFVNDSGLEI